MTFVNILVKAMQKIEIGMAGLLLAAFQLSSRVNLIFSKKGFSLKVSLCVVLMLDFNSSEFLGSYTMKGRKTAATAAKIAAIMNVHSLGSRSLVNL